VESNKIKLARAKARAISMPCTIPDVLDPAFPIQSDLIKHPARFKALFATRRFGKSYTAGLYLVKEALENPGVSVLYIALTRDSAKKIMWKDVMKPLNRKFKLGLKFNETLLTATLPNGSILYFMGADSSEDDKDKLLGQKYRLAIIDEAASFSINMRELVYGILKPAMADLNGTIMMIGTPSNFTQGLFFDVTTGVEPGWHLVKGDTKDNPYMAQKWATEIAELTLNQPYIIETPKFKQMYLGQWSVDDDKLVYKFNAERNIYSDLPKQLSPNGWRYTLGIDLGYEDDSAFVLTGYHEHDPHLYVIRSYARKHMTLDEVMNMTLEFMRDEVAKPSRIIIDGAAKQAVESMRVRGAIPFEYADKTGKVDFIELLNSDLIQAKIKIHKSNQTLIDEMASLVWETKGEKITIPRKEHPALPNHLCDALLYGWRMSFHFHSTKPDKVIAVGSKEWYIQQSDNIWENERENLIKQSGNGDGWPSDDSGFGQF
jgi:phage terminase large subunit